MSDHKSTADVHVEEYTSKILSANMKWAERMNQTFPQYFPKPQDGQEPKVGWFWFHLSAITLTWGLLPIDPLARLFRF